MKTTTTYVLGPADLKSAIESWMAAKNMPVTDSDTFVVDATGNVTITVVAEIAPDVPAPVVVVAPPLPPIVPLVQAPRPGHMITADPPWSATGIDTEFGYRDAGDNGIGFFDDPASGKAYGTNNDKLVGISLPREVLLSTFGISDDWRTKPTVEVWAEHCESVLNFTKAHKITANVDGGGKSLRGIPLVDAGPTRTTGNLVDLTDAAAKVLGTGGKAICTFELLCDGKPMELRGIDFVKGVVG